MEKYIIHKGQECHRTHLCSLCSADKPYYKQIQQGSIAIKENENYRNNFFVAYLNDTLVGFVYGFTFDKTLFPQFLFVHQDHRQRGIGTLLLKKLEEHSNCVTSMVYFHKSLETYYAKQDYELGMDLRVGLKMLH